MHPRLQGIFQDDRDLEMWNNAQYKELNWMKPGIVKQNNTILPPSSFVGVFYHSLTNRTKIGFRAQNRILWLELEISPLSTCLILSEWCFVEGCRTLGGSESLGPWLWRFLFSSSIFTIFLTIMTWRIFPIIFFLHQVILKIIELRTMNWNLWNCNLK